MARWHGKRHSAWIAHALLVLGLFAQSLSAHAVSQKDLIEAQALLARAARLSLLHDAPGTAFHQYMQLKLLRLSQGQTEGEYVWISGPDRRWRQEIKFGGYEQVAVGDAQKIYKKRNLDFTPKPAVWIQVLLRNYDQLVLQDDETVKSVYQNSSLRCVDLKRPSMARSICFDRAGTLHSVTYPDILTSYYYIDYKPFADKFFAQVLRVTAHDMEVVEAKVQQVEAELSPYPSLFLPPPGTAGSATCANPVLSKAISTVEPAKTSYWPGGGMVRRYGTVSVAVQVQKDGRVGRMVVTESMNPEIDRDVLKAVQQWRFLPFTCDGVPVESETEVVIDFSSERTTSGFNYPLKF